MDINGIKQFIDWFEKLTLIEVHEESKWTVTGGYLYGGWLEYPEEILYGGVIRKDGVALMNIANCSNETVTLVLLESMEVECDEQ